MAVQPVHRYSPYKTGPAAVPVPYRGIFWRYTLNVKSRNYIGVFRKIFFYFFYLLEKFYMGTQKKDLALTLRASGPIG